MNKVNSLSRYEKRDGNFIKKKKRAEKANKVGGTQLRPFRLS